jgi:uncharacterized protein (DUF58 family)
MDLLRYAQMRAYSGFRRRLMRRLTPAGRLALGALVAAGVMGFDTASSMTFMAFAFLAGLFLVAAAASLLFRARVEAGRRLPRLATAGERLPYTVWVRTLDGKARGGLGVAEELPDPRPSFAEFRALRSLPDETRAERFTGYGRWLELIARKRIAGGESRALPDLLPGRDCELEMELTPARRGILRLDALTVARPDPLGLINSLSRRAATQSVLVLPKRYPVPNLTLPGSRRYQKGGVSLSSRVGDSLEFRGLRDYRPGDPPRRIHWRSWAKTGTPVVKDYEDEYFVRHALVLDTFAGPEDAAALEEAVSVAASFACTLLTQESLLDMLFVGDKTYRVTAGRGLGGPETLLEVLACVEPCTEKPFSELSRSATARGESLSGCVCVLLGFDDARRELVRGLRALGVPTTVAVVAQAGELSDAVCAKEGVHRLEPGDVAAGLARMAAAP